MGRMKGLSPPLQVFFFSLLIQRSLGPEEGDFKLWILKLQRKKLEATQNLQLRAAPPPHCLRELDHILPNCVVIVSSFPPGNHPSCLGVKDRERRTSLRITPKEEGKLSSNQGNFTCMKTPAEPKARRHE